MAWLAAAAIALLGFLADRRLDQHRLGLGLGHDQGSFG